MQLYTEVIKSGIQELPEKMKQCTGEIMLMIEAEKSHMVQVFIPLN